ncbi:hypothetical protein SUGI_0082250 [Cryptomeria japonica]|nr:hypothetical protein SUGI_0082250 [Cryptomeria japonica]
MDSRAGSAMAADVFLDPPLCFADKNVVGIRMRPVALPSSEEYIDIAIVGRKNERGILVSLAGSNDDSANVVNKQTATEGNGSYGLTFVGEGQQRALQELDKKSFVTPLRNLCVDFGCFGAATVPPNDNEKDVTLLCENVMVSTADDNKDVTPLPAYEEEKKSANFRGCGPRDKSVVSEKNAEEDFYNPRAREPVLQGDFNIVKNRDRGDRGNRGYGGFDDEIRQGSDRDIPSRDDEVDNWCTMKKSMPPPRDQPKRCRYNENTSYRDPGLDSDRWGKKESFTDDQFERPRFSLNLRTTSDPVLNHVGADGTPRLARDNPFGKARPQEEKNRSKKKEEWRATILQASYFQKQILR